MRDLNAIATIAYRDVIKFLRDRSRIVATFMFPIIFVGILGSSLQSNLSEQAGYNFLTFVFIGTLGQTLFQSTASGIISLIEDRENDFSQEMFVSPISRFSIIVGKIVGESFVAYLQLFGILILGVLLGVPLSWPDIVRILPIGLVVCFMGGAFGVLVLSQLNNQRAANQIFPFLVLPQFFLAGVFSPIKELPPVLFFLSRLAPMTYAVDFVRGVYYAGKPEYAKVVLFSPWVSASVIAVVSIGMIAAGTYFFITNERNR